MSTKLEWLVIVILPVLCAGILLVVTGCEQEMFQEPAEMPEEPEEPVTREEESRERREDDRRELPDDDDDDWMDFSDDDDWMDFSDDEPMMPEDDMLEDANNDFGF